jgi:hypothetical protein
MKAEQGIRVSIEGIWVSSPETNIGTQFSPSVPQAAFIDSEGFLNFNEIKGWLHD